MYIQLILISLATVFCAVSLSENQCIILTRTTDSNWRKSSCQAWMKDDYKHSGIYMIYPFGTHKGVKVYCNQDTDGGGWMLIQKRFNGEVDFYRNWKSYQVGFGNIGGEHWLGLDNIHEITSRRDYELRIDLEDFQGNKGYAKYGNFKVGGAASNYKLTISRYSGDVGDSMIVARQNVSGMMFTTFDRDNDRLNSNNCAQDYHGAWWYRNCHESNLNGEYNSTVHGRGIYWYSWHKFNYSMKTTQLKIRPH